MFRSFLHMPIVEFSDNDLLRNKIVEPGWYEMAIGPWSEWTDSSDKQSKNTRSEFVIIRNDDNGSEDFAGVPVECMFNSKPKARVFIEGFLRAMGLNVEAKRYELGGTEGDRVVAHVINDTWEGRLKNKIDNKFRMTKDKMQEQKAQQPA